MGGDTTKLAHNKHLREVLSLSSKKMKKTHIPSPTSEIIFSNGHDNPMIISIVIVNIKEKRVFID